MAVQLLGSTYTEHAATTVTVPLPAETVEGCLLAMVSWSGYRVTSTGMGWNRWYHSLPEENLEALGVVYTKRATAEDAANKTTTFIQQGADPGRTVVLALAGATEALRFMASRANGTLSASTVTRTFGNIKAGSFGLWFAGARNSAATAPTIDRGQQLVSTTGTNFATAARIETFPDAIAGDSTVPVNFSLPARTGEFVTALLFEPLEAVGSYADEIAALQPAAYWTLSETDGTFAATGTLPQQLQLTGATGSAPALQRGAPPILPGLSPSFHNGTSGNVGLSAPYDGISGESFTFVGYFAPHGGQMPPVNGTIRDVFGFNTETRLARFGDAGKPIDAGIALGGPGVTQGTNLKYGDGAFQFAVTYDHITGLVTTYQNGRVNWTVTQSTNGFNPGGGLFRMLRNGYDDRTLHGRISDVALFRKALTATEVRRLFMAAETAPSLGAKRWTGTELADTLLAGWWDGSALQTVEVQGMWDGTQNQPLQ